MVEVIGVWTPLSLFHVDPRLSSIFTFLSVVPSASLLELKRDEVMEPCAALPFVMSLVEFHSLSLYSC